MRNVTHEIKGDKLIITVDIGKAAVGAAPPSSSGKTKLIATTGGACSIAVPGATGAAFALNVTCK